VTDTLRNTKGSAWEPTPARVMFGAISFLLPVPGGCRSTTIQGNSTPRPQREAAGAARLRAITWRDAKHASYRRPKHCHQSLDDKTSACRRIRQAMKMARSWAAGRCPLVYCRQGAGQGQRRKSSRWTGLHKRRRPFTGAAECLPRTVDPLDGLEKVRRSLATWPSA
jgi:hypothetical protein